MLEVIVLAAGKGSRMKSDKAKVLHTLAGKPMLFHVLDRALELNAKKIHLVVGHGSGQVKQVIAEDEKYSTIEINYVEQTEQLGTGHAVQQVLPFITDDSQCLILYGDVPLIKKESLIELIENVTEETMGLLTVKFDKPAGYGRIIRNSKGQVLEIVEQKDASLEQQKITEVNSGIMAVNGSHLLTWLPQLSNDNAQKEYYLTDIISIANKNKINVIPSQPKNKHEVLGVNNRVQQSQIERIYQQEIAQGLLEAGVSILDPQRFDCRGQLRVGTDCVIDINCIFIGEVVLGNNVNIGANCIVQDCQIGDDVEIKPNSVLEQSKVFDHCVIGPYARLRPGTVLNSKAKIGNFVEVKKAVIGEGSKVNHLSYIGDAKVGCDVNIGAGTITCNYDGVNKFVTELGNGVFVGSNTALVAPVSIEENATIGAGSVITSDVDKEQLALTRAPQKNIDGWQRPTKKN